MKFLKRIMVVILILSTMVLVYTSSLIGVNSTTKAYLEQLESKLIEKGYKANYLVISGRRWAIDNYLLSQLNGAAKKSKHLKGETIDLLVLDVNMDGLRNAADVDIVYQILDQEIIKNKGGLGSYKNGSGFFNQQMVHFDSRGKRARWNR